ncbi:MAG: formylglycine-generating enzyme family protein [Xanthomonadales bacterium]|jgi:formylglycine-generating enzyme required for sulfatase activity|nr:formylglycine-generating enzyme family protein [Xanthomonadales bacterium]
MGWFWAAGLGFTAIAGLAWVVGQTGRNAPIEVRSLARTSDGLALVPVGGALPAVGVAFRHALKGGGMGPEMVLLPGGRFLMGSPKIEVGDADEGPVRVVELQFFAIGVTELTFADWDLCVDRGSCGGYRPDDFNFGRGNRPVINVSWEDAQRYVEWLQVETGAAYRLPSESEWEYAARAGSQKPYWWGDQLGWKRANCGVCGNLWDLSQTAPVKSFSANGFGLHDTSGNVWEWVQDCYAQSYAGAPMDGRAVEKTGCTTRVLRGGSWTDSPVWLRSANREMAASTEKGFTGGFRAALGQ